MNAILTRAPSTDQGTFGNLVLDNGMSYCTLELPWEENKPSESCIPPGVYNCKWIKSPKHGNVYQVLDVPDRSMIEIHPANFAGDKDRGFISELEGCIALGQKIGVLQGQLALLSSKFAITDFHVTQRKQDFKLTVRWAR